MNATEAKELLQKYGLKTSVKAIKERIANSQILSHSYLSIASNVLHFDPLWVSVQQHNEYYALAVELRSADLALLCSLAEKGERLEKVVKDSRSAYQEQANISGGLKKVEYNIAVAVLDEIITEAEGE